MPTFRLFYAWQSDRPSELCRNFAAVALRDAAAAVGAELGISIEVDSDTQNEPGTPPVTDTILDKIRECDAFVGDMTFVSATDGGKLVPNPNVMAEYGYALALKSTRKIILIMNTAFGPPEALPFDLGHLRHPIKFNAPIGIAEAVRRAERQKLTNRLERALKVLVISARADSVGEQANDSEAIEQARQMVLSLSSATEWGQKPAIVSKPKIVLHLAPFAAFKEVKLDVREVRKVISPIAPIHFTPSAFELDENEWWVRGKGEIVPGKPNPETTWYVRFIRPGAFEIALNIGKRIDDDERVLVKGLQVEAAIVDMLDKCSAAAAHLNLSGPGIVSGALIGADDVDVQLGRLFGRFRKPVIWLGETTMDAIGDRLGNHLQQMFDALWTGSGIGEGSISFRQGQWAGYMGDRAYAL